MRAGIGAVLIVLAACGSAPSVAPLATIEIRYVEDGAADASVAENPDPRVKALVDERDRAIPLLIDCLTSREASKASVVTGDRTSAVPLGYVCLDVLMAITEGEDASVADCADDGFGACMREGFYFRPDETDAARIIAVQKAWRAAYGKGRIVFAYPSWWPPAE